MTSVREEFLTLTNLFCEEQLSDEQCDRLQTLLRSDRELQNLFVEFVQLHGLLGWDAGLVAGNLMHHIDDDADAMLDRELTLAAASQNFTASLPARRTSGRLIAAAAACLLAAFTLAALFRTQDHGHPLVDTPPNETSQLAAMETPGIGGVAEQSVAITDANASPQENRNLPPLKLNALESDASPVTPVPMPRDMASSEPPAEPMDDAQIVAEIDRLIQVGWEENNVTAASEANDHEWVRRAYLTLTGRIPSIEQVSGFVTSPSPRKRDALVDQLLSDPQTAENLAVIWTNLLIGRSNARGVDQESLFDYLLEQFSENRPWMETVGELIAAEGRSDQNGATNFLLAHLNDQATPATAVTARLFLGQQVHCTQCHDHPFAKERQQQEFWSLNAFFKQAQRQLIPAPAASGVAERVWTLTDSGKPGMTFYDTLRGQKKAVLPEFAGETLPADATKSRRSELSRLLAADNQHQVARAMINRMWAQFFGYGFTNPVDDIGGHNPVSHPLLFDHLTNAFVDSDYDLRRLMRWLTLSQAFRLSSVQSAEAMVLDDPQEGGVPLFSRTYPRHMGPEQVYDSIRIAMRSVADLPIDSSIGTDHRRDWVEQFVRSYGTDENDEQLAFEGNISQALLMMNGKDLEEAIPLAASRITTSLRDGSTAIALAAERLALATLNREPTENEEKAFRNRVRSLSRSLPSDEAMKTATEDMLWAYLNSSEFVSVH